MTGLTERAAGGDPPPGAAAIEEAHRRWQESMRRQAGELHRLVARRSPGDIARACGGTAAGEEVRLDYWGRPVVVAWSERQLRFETGEPLPEFDAAMVLYYLHRADGTPRSRRWIGFRELPDGAFYHLAYQRYSGDRLAKDFGGRLEALEGAAAGLDGEPIEDHGPHAFAFRPLPRIHLAAIVWPGDDEFQARGAILFDASASHYMTTDGLALLGGGLAGRLARAGRAGEP
jgi:hypothetical protein